MNALVFVEDHVLRDRTGTGDRDARGEPTGDRDRSGDGDRVDRRARDLQVVQSFVMMYTSVPPTTCHDVSLSFMTCGRTRSQLVGSLV